MREVPGLIALGQKYADHGLQLLFFPCNQFCSEEPGLPPEIADFYVKKHGLPASWLMQKADVNGPNTQSTYSFLKSAKPGDIEWNFSKFIIGRDGQVLERFGQGVKPEQLERQLPTWLQ